jgi:UDP-2-acetamido-3-amino-2,3-dideoxy-glucuronate N-acetyltransferase
MRRYEPIGESLAPRYAFAMLPAPVPIPTISDERGSLAVAELGAALPFPVARSFIIYDLPGAMARGGHAHRRCEQFLIAVAGSVAVTVDDGSERQEHLLDSPAVGLHIPAGVWSEQRYPGPASRLLVLASEPYDESEYIRDRDEFLRFKGISA